ncbi:hypothetical protein BV378_20340 [Nostoc sp. RF31YmG]|jgi:hypothetical protein|nr:hypothetical protein BV378_20340 [Nostoc sp. RF31YmG]
MQIAFTGARQLTKQQERDIYKDFAYFISNHNADWHVGDAPGLDDFVRRAAAYYNKTLTVYEVKGHQKWHFAERSKRMIDAIADLPDAWLYAFPNKLCPEGCKPCKNPNGGGSGTWLTIAYAHYRGLQIYLFPQFKTRFGDDSWKPDWMRKLEGEQLSLF